VKTSRLFYLFGLIFLIYIPFDLKGQNDYPLDINYYNFVRYDKNKFDFPGDSIDFERFYSKMDTVILNGRGKISIVHIGGSHIQADVYSGRTRERLQSFLPGLNGGRGMVFPYRIANTNNPGSYKTSSTGEWNTCKNVELNKNCHLGLSGITAITSDSSATISFSLRQDSLVKYYFNRIRVFHSINSSSFVPLIEQVNIILTEINEDLGCSIFYLDNDYYTFTLKLNKTSANQTSFELYGISLENEDPGIIYHSIGINGASFPSFLRCSLLEKHLIALNPDMVILSLGTNDAYTKKFSPDFYRANYEEMIHIIKKAAPKAAILNTVANDSYLFRRYPNKNTELASEVIHQVAKRYNCGVWNFYEIMGGFNSSKVWRNNNLMRSDLVHFNNEGYLFIGDLLFNAFIQSYDNHIDNLY